MLKNIWRGINSKKYQKVIILLLTIISMISSGIWTIFTFAHNRTSEYGTNYANQAVEKNEGNIIGGNSNIREFNQVVFYSQEKTGSNDDTIVYLSNGLHNGSAWMFSAFPSNNDIPTTPSCEPIQGSKAKILNKKRGALNQIWSLIRVLNGNCKGKVGWVNGQEMRLHP